MSDFVHDGWGEDLSVRGSLSFFSKYTARYLYSYNQFGGWIAGFSGTAVCNGRSVGWQKVQQRSHKMNIVKRKAE